MSLILSVILLEKDRTLMYWHSFNNKHRICFLISFSLYFSSSFFYFLSLFSLNSITVCLYWVYCISSIQSHFVATLWYFISFSHSYYTLATCKFSSADLLCANLYEWKPYKKNPQLFFNKLATSLKTYPFLLMYS